MLGAQHALTLGDPSYLCILASVFARHMAAVSVKGDDLPDNATFFVSLHLRGDIFI